MDPRRLLTFRTVAHERSFSRAAERLSLSQPSVSHQIALLEREVGARLLDRGRGGVALTPAGEVLLEHADQIAWRLELADRQVAGVAGERRETLRIGAFPTAMAAYLPATVTRLREQDPDLRVLLGEVTPSTLEPLLLSGDFDIALSYQDAAAERREIDGVERIDLLRDGFLVGLPPGHRLADEDGPLRLAQLAEDPWILASTEGFLAKSLREAGFEPRVVATTQDPVATHGLIARGIGVGLVPGLLADDHPGIAIRPVDGGLRARDVYALLPPGERHPLVAKVIVAMKEAAADFIRSAAGVGPQRSYVAASHSSKLGPASFAPGLGSTAPSA
ncbi:MAG: LysR family transcriptional regulator [Actinobacteria bacterium]|nr:LysR family transcriptional regulator [Actinomycetota bacterium]